MPGETRRIETSSQRDFESAPAGHPRVTTTLAARERVLKMEDTNSQELTGEGGQTGASGDRPVGSCSCVVLSVTMSA